MVVIANNRSEQKTLCGGAYVMCHQLFNRIKKGLKGKIMTIHKGSEANRLLWYKLMFSWFDSDTTANFKNK